MTDYTGRIALIDESSNMGGFWGFIADGNYNEYPNNVYILRDGDVLTILNPEDPGVAWTGTLNLRPYLPNTVTVNGFWIRSNQAGENVNTWAQYFIKQLPAKLTTANQVIDPDFQSPASGFY